MRKFGILRWFFTCVFILAFASGGSAQIEAKKLKNINARSIGPAGMSGRVASIEAVASDPNIIYVGAATGGLWKSTNGGVTFEPIFDDQAVSSIGAVAVFQKNPSIVWAGTGEANPRNSVGVGHGVYKSIDGGATWKFLGLGPTEKISRIALDPDNPDIAFVAAMGTTWGENPERGIFKTTDGGKTWQNVLFVDEKTGCADLEMDPKNPNKLFAAMWEHRRWPWFFNSGGPGSGLYVTYDAGETWKKLTDRDGLPKGELGRIGLAIARNNPDIVYALVEAKKSVLLRSEDGGKKWETINDKPNVNSRPFYYCDIRVDPENENRVYSLNSRLQVSNDGGKNFEFMFPYMKVHPDNHALWINPNDGRLMINGNDGGIAISRDRGKTWRFVENLPLAQFYHINIDNEIPYNVYGGLQDNGSWRGPSNVWENGGIRNYYWDEIGFGDGFAALSDPTDNNIAYCMSQGGYLMRTNNLTGERKLIRPDGPDDVKLRFAWNAGIAIDPFNPTTLYYGSQFIHKSTDRGDSWTIISPDLTTNDPEKQKQNETGGLTKDVTGAENHTTILTIAPSSLEQGVIWVGTDDGNVQLTLDGGETWENFGDRIDKKLPDGTWCPHIEPSKHDPGTAYVVFDDHRRSNWTTYIYKTTEYGKKWENLAKNDPTEDDPDKMWGFAHVIEEDHVDKDLLFLGTEFGLFASFNGGKNWRTWDHGVPTVPVRALIIHPRDNDLIIGTHGRAAYIMDNIAPLRGMSEEKMAEPLRMFEIPAAYLYWVKQVGSMRFPGDSYFSGETKPYGAMITYSVNHHIESDEENEDEKPEKREVTIEVLDEAGSVIRRMKGENECGINRVYWRLNEDGIIFPGRQPNPDGFMPPGLEVLQGVYTVRVKYGEFSKEQTVEVKVDPRENYSLKDRRDKYETLKRVQGFYQIVTEAVKRIENLEKNIDNVIKKAGEMENDSGKELEDAGKELKKKLSELSAKFTNPRGRQGIFARDKVITSKIGPAMGALGSTYDAPTPTHMVFVRQAENAMNALLGEFNTFFAEDVSAFKEKVRTSELSFFQDNEPLDLNWKKKK